MKKILIIIGILVLTLSCDNSIKFHKSSYETKAEAPFSDAVSANGFLFLSGQIGMDHSSRTLVTGGLKAETHQTIQNIQEVLQYHNLELNDVVKVMVVLSDMSDFQEFNEIYKSYFPNKPARTTFAASGLARGAKIEIEVVAAR